MDMQTGDIENRILDVLVEREIIPARHGWELHPAHGGLNSRVYFARRGADAPAITLRLSTDAPELLQREGKILTELGEQGACAPPLIALIDEDRLADRHVLVHAYVEGTTTPLDTVAPARLRSLGTCLAQVHSNRRDAYEIWPWLKPERGTREQAFRERVEAMTRYATFTDGLQNMVRPLYDMLRSLPLPDDASWHESSFSLLHGDLSVGNLVWDGDALTLIDWEYARAGDPAEDLAYVLAEQPLPPDAIATLHQSYVNAGGDPTAIERAIQYAPLASLDSVLWWGDYHLSRGTDPITTAEVNHHLTHAIKRLSVQGRR